jgi:hypothetical protein
MKTSDISDVIKGDEQCRDGHYRAKQELRTKTVSCAVSFLCPSPLDAVRFGQFFQRFRKPSMRVF